MVSDVVVQKKLHMKTTAAILYEVNKPVQIEEIEIPKLKYGQVLIEMVYSGVCHSQLMEVRGRRGEDIYLPHLLGTSWNNFRPQPTVHSNTI